MATEPAPTMDTSPSPFQTLTFKHTWRPYQARVLDAIDHHLKDQRLHIVAAPGAGKTTLGLEVFRKLGRKALVLSPTRTIRDQWLRRLDDFGDFDDPVRLPWVSRDLSQPSVITSITYQALHAQLSQEVEPEEELEDPDAMPDPSDDAHPMVEALKAHGIEVLILDEAHHLRAEWWKVLDRVMTELPYLTLVSLTATPPYDANEQEWSKYEALCGPIDEEISVPELVKVGTLCPHQDYLWAVDATRSERDQVEAYDAAVRDLCQSLFEHSEFGSLVLSHPWLVDVVEERAVLKTPELAMALLVFAKAKKVELPQGLCDFLDLSAVDIPSLGRRWWQVLVEQALFSNTFNRTETQLAFIKSLKQQLRASQLLYRREVRITRSRLVERSLSLSAAKLDACLDLHRIESRCRRGSLRQVILTDFIRDEHRHSPVNSGDVSLGAWPVFERLIEKSPIPEHLALLTGRLTVIPASLLAPLADYIETEGVKTRPLSEDDRFLILDGPLNRLARGLTHLLLDGHLRTLVGTRALLGEGWDAPVINSLILATSVGSFMLTNQMRGRALRVDPQAPDKVSSIWHLIAVDNQCPSGLSDYHELVRRFETFVGLSEQSDAIESGFGRLRADGLPKPALVNAELSVDKLNRQMRQRFDQREGLADRWQSALQGVTTARVHPTVSTPRIPGIRRYHIEYTLKYLITQLGAALGSVFSYILQADFQGNFRLFLWALGAGLAGVLLYQWKTTLKIVRAFLMHLPVDGALYQIGEALKTALCEARLIETAESQLTVRLQPNSDGTFQIALEGGTFYESSLFADCFAELLAPIENPRFMLRRQGWLYGMSRDDYHAVPLAFGLKQERVEPLCRAFEAKVGPVELVNCRTAEGRARLLKARMKAFSATFRRDLKRQDRWQ